MPEGRLLVFTQSILRLTGGSVLLQDQAPTVRTTNQTYTSTEGVCMNIEPTINPEAEPDSPSLLGRRSFVLGAAALGLLAGSPAALAATKKKTTKAKGPAKTSGTIALQSNNADDKSKKGMEAVVAAFNARNAGSVKLNTVAGELYRTQLTQYLTSSKPPEVLTWLAGKAAQNYADQGLLLDISDVWASPEMAGYSSALKGLSTDSNGKQIFVPIYYYWCGVYYRPSKFAEWGVKPPKTFEEYKTLCKTVQDKGVTPIGMGLSDTPWVASFWFDYLNLRVNGAKFHRDVLSGKKSFNSPEVKAVFAKWQEVLPFMDKQAKGLAFAEAQTKFYKGETATYVAGNWWALGARKTLVMTSTSSSSRLSTRRYRLPRKLRLTDSSLRRRDPIRRSRSPSCDTSRLQLPRSST
jgi:multiple sugar transport system substrate-binding protein